MEIITEENLTKTNNKLIVKSPIEISWNWM